MEPDEPCGTHVLPPHHRVDPGPGDCPPLFKFVVRFKLLPLGEPRSMLVWEAGPVAALDFALRHLVGRYGPSGVVPGSVELGGAGKRASRPSRARVGLFDPIVLDPDETP